MIIYDALGNAWELKDGHIRMVDVEPEWEMENGYPAQDWSEAVQVLNDLGYMEKSDEHE